MILFAGAGDFAANTQEKEDSRGPKGRHRHHVTRLLLRNGGCGALRPREALNPIIRMTMS